MGLIRSFVLAAAVVGFVAGSLTADRQDATATSGAYSISNHPGGTSNVLNCGWHGTCLGAPNDGTGLDWDNAAHQPVYWRSWSSNTAGMGWAALATIVHNGVATCKQTHVDLQRTNGHYGGRIAFLHTYSWVPGWQFYVNSGGPLQPAWTQLGVGQTATEPPGCQTTGPHLHHRAGAGTWTKNTGYYPGMATCNKDVVETDCGAKNIIGNWALSLVWVQ